MTHCSQCGNSLTPQQVKENQQKFFITHTYNHVEHVDVAVIYSDAFFEIISGNRKGGLVHKWNITNSSPRIM